MVGNRVRCCQAKAAEIALPANGHVSLWHLADINFDTENVRFLGESGHEAIPRAKAWQRSLELPREVHL